MEEGTPLPLGIYSGGNSLGRALRHGLKWSINTDHDQEQKTGVGAGKQAVLISTAHASHIQASRSVLTFKLPGQQIPQPAFQQWRDAPHEEQPHSPAWSPEATARTFAHRPLEEQRHGKSRSLTDTPQSLPCCSVYMRSS